LTTVERERNMKKETVHNVKEITTSKHEEQETSKLGHYEKDRNEV